MRRRTAYLGDRPFDVQWEETETTVQASVNGRRYVLEVRRLDSQTLWFGWNGKSIEATAIMKDGKYEISIKGRKVAVEFRDTIRSGRRGGSMGGNAVAEIRAPMPGKVVRLLLKQDDVVEARQGILVMEAMKMQNEIRSPRSGRILTIDAREGDAVNAGDLIARVGD